jgi:hypothetical protein
MYNSKEIRWFSETLQPDIVNWFRKHHLRFDQHGNKRTDFYLPFQSKEIGIKLREKNIEVKQKLNRSAASKFGLNSSGYYEDWTKWSFTTDKNDMLSSLIEKEEYTWHKIIKDRIGIKLSTFELKSNDKILNDLYLFSLKEEIPYGCQIEYTKIVIDDNTWFTFGVEWFGEAFIKLSEETIQEILGNTILKPDDSYGYPEFLYLHG